MAAQPSMDPGDGRKWSRPAEDLSGERVLRDCERVEFEGKKRPSIGRIVLLGKLGKGGMGVVYFGVNPRLCTEVAVKVLPPPDDDEGDAVDRFIREGRIAAGLFSDHLVSVLDVDKDERSGAHFLVMEFVRGCTAGHWMKDTGLDGRRTRPTEREALDVCIAATKGLAAAHLEGILHRDVKPENILIPKAHGRPIELDRAKLADLGLARPESAPEGITATAIGMGTPGFMAPEQSRDARSARKPADVFSMGATLYAVLTGEPPFRGDSAMDTLLRTMRGDHKPVREVRPDVSQPTNALLQRCLDVEPSKRFPDAPALLDAMEICRSSLETPYAPGETVGRIEGLAAREERGKRFESGPPPAPRAPGARRRPAHKAAGAPVGVFAVVGVAAIAGLLVWSAVGGSATPAAQKPAPTPVQPTVAGKKPGVVETGYDVSSEPPGAAIEIDGRLVGATPRFKAYPAYDKHDVRVTMSGFAPWTEKAAVVRADGPTKVFARLVRATNSVTIEGASAGHVKLVRDGDPPKEYSVHLDTAGRVTIASVEAGTYAVFIERAGFDPYKGRLVVPVETAPPPFVAKMVEHPGKLTVDSLPTGAEVFVDDRPVGKGPIVGLALPAGRHTLSLRMPGYADAVRTIDVRGDQTTPAGVVVLSAYATVDLSQLGDDVVATIDGKPVAKDAKLSPGPVEVTFERKGYARQTRRLEAQPGAALAVVPDSWDKFQAQIDLSSLPEGTRVLVDGVEMKGPTIGWPGPKKARLDVRRAGYEREIVAVAATLGTKQPLPEIKWTEVKTQVDLAELPPGLSLWIDGKPVKEGAVVKPGPHALAFSGIANAPTAQVVVECQRWIRPPLYLREPGVAAALDWLARHQSEDGGWSPDRFIPPAKMRAEDGPGETGNDVGVTGLALSAFLGAGETPDAGPHKATVAAAVKYLVSRQQKDGCIGPRVGSKYGVQSAIATIPVVDAYRLTGDPEARDAAQRAVGFVMKAKTPYTGWPEVYPPTNEPDTDATFWYVRALWAATRAGLAVDKQALLDGCSFIDKMTEPEFGKTGYRERGGAPAREQRMMTLFPAERSECLTAAGVCIRFWAGRDMKGDEFIGKGADLMVKKLMRWDTEAGCIDFCYWYYGTLANVRVGGDWWKKWREAGVAALVKTQKADAGRDDRGSWDPADCWGLVGGRVYSTAVNCLTLECLGGK